MKRPNWILVAGIITAVILITGGLVRLRPVPPVSPEPSHEITVKKAADSAKKIAIKPIWEIAKEIVRMYD